MSTYPPIYDKLLLSIHYFACCLLRDPPLPGTGVCLTPRFQLLFPLTHPVAWCQSKLQSCCSDLLGAPSHLWEKSRFLGVRSKAPHCLPFQLPSSLRFIYSHPQLYILLTPNSTGLLKHGDLCTSWVFCLKTPLANPLLMSLDYCIIPFAWASVCAPHSLLWCAPNLW